MTKRSSPAGRKQEPDAVATERQRTRYNEIGRPYATRGKLFDDSTGKNPGNLGYADYEYRNDQPATTLWFHDHALGVTCSAR